MARPLHPLAGGLPSGTAGCIQHPASSIQQSAAGRFCGQGRRLEPNSLTERAGLQSADTHPSAASWEGTTLHHPPHIFQRATGSLQLWMQSETRCANPERTGIVHTPGKQRAAFAQESKHSGHCEKHLWFVQRCVCFAGARLSRLWGTLSLKPKTKRGGRPARRGSQRGHPAADPLRPWG